MDDKLKSRYEAKSAELRADLKTWETEWANSHSGSKPGREDIKNNPDIAKKYKDYNKCRDILSGKVPPPSRSASKPAKRKPDEQPMQTPVKRTKHAETPVKQRDNEKGLMGTPAISRKLFSPTPVTAIGPTPQRDGRVLGLFDLLIEKELGTPKKGDKGAEGGKGKITATPSKRQSSADPDSGRLGRTPMSSSKRQMLNTFMTPLKNRNGDHEIGDGGTPSVSKLQFDTPAFLKRHSFPIAAADENEDKPAPLRLPRKPMVRGLSEIVASLRQIEEEHAEPEDDLDALREMESMEAGEPMPSITRAPPASKVLDEERILAPDRPQDELPLGGFDDEGAYDSPTEDQVGRDGQPLRVYKKKGQKRTTRKSNMKPVRAKRAGSVDLGGKKDEDAEASEEDESGSQAEVLDSDAGSDFDDGVAAAAAERKKKKQQQQEKGGKIKKAVRKVNELTHANFQKLKLKNGGAKGGPGINSRFRRRR
ncbi:DNA replication and checkpoint protein [Sarocladium implicatum]|nr:DNA replication and checkpoint protein [Sarocladium implicatum]